MRYKLLQNALILVCFASIICFAGSALAQDQSAEPTLQVATDQSFPPFEMTDQDTGEVVGFDMSLMAEVADRVGFKYTLKEMPFPGIVPALQTASVDAGIAAIVITQKRDKVTDFSIPYYQAGLALLVRSDNDSIHSLKDIKNKGLTIATKIGSSSYMFLQKQIGDSAATIKAYPLTSNMYMAVMAGAVDGVLYDSPNVKYFKSTKGHDNVKIVGPLYAASFYGIFFPQGSKWVKPVNAALKSIMEDGTYDKIYKKWFGESTPAAWHDWMGKSFYQLKEYWSDVEG